MVLWLRSPTTRVCFYRRGRSVFIHKVATVKWPYSKQAQQRPLSFVWNNRIKGKSFYLFIFVTQYRKKKEIFIIGLLLRIQITKKKKEKKKQREYFGRFLGSYFSWYYSDCHYTQLGCGQKCFLRHFDILVRKRGMHFYESKCSDEALILMINIVLWHIDSSIKVM